MVIAGKVQGVGFRYWLQNEANALGLDGWVRNRADGAVEALIAGPEGSVDRLVSLCRRGPRGAVVSDVMLGGAAAPRESGFEILADA